MYRPLLVLQKFLGDDAYNQVSPASPTNKDRMDRSFRMSPLSRM